MLTTPRKKTKLEITALLDLKRQLQQHKCDELIISITDIGEDSAKTMKAMTLQEEKKCRPK
jgi:hypothetical protein